MTYDEKIPDFALKPAAEPEDDGFDPTPYEKLLEGVCDVPKETPQEPQEEPEETSAEDLEEPREEIPKEEEIDIPEPVIIPKSKPEPKAKPEPAKTISLVGKTVYTDLKLTDIMEEMETKVFVEEDILVPDIKPDMRAILTMDGAASLSNKEIHNERKGEGLLKIMGEVSLQTIYLPEDREEDPIITIQSRLPFKSDWPTSVSPLSNLAITPSIEKIDYTVINERKFRVKITLKLSMREYADTDLQFFEKINGEDLQLLKEKLQLTNVVTRKKDVFEMEEDLKIREGGAKPEQILKYDISIVENHKQISSEKIIINASVYCNVLYLAEDDSKKDASPQAQPYLYQGKAEFTQFIPLDQKGDFAGSKVIFDGRDLSIRIREDDEDGDGREGFKLSGNITTNAEIYENLEKEIVADIYHSQRETTYNYVEKKTNAIKGSGVMDISVREMLNVPEKYGSVEKIIYISGRVKESRSTIEIGKNIVEGTIETKLLCIPAGKSSRPFALSQDLSFRGSMEIPGIAEGMSAGNEISIKDLWFDKLNNRQIEINGNLLISSTVLERKTYKLIKNVSFVESAEEPGREPGMVVYITRHDDNLWKIAKKYRTTMSAIRQINGIEEKEDITQGMKLLIVK